MKLSTLSEALHPRLKATMAEINADLIKALVSSGVKFTPDSDVELKYSAGGFPAGWNVGTLEIDSATHTIWANFNGQVGVAIEYTLPNRWYTPAELIATSQRRAKREVTFKAKPEANRLVSMLKKFGQPISAYFRPPSNPAKSTYDEGWYKSTDALWMGDGIIEYIKTHNLTSEAIEKLKDSFSMSVMPQRWKQVQEKAGVILPEEPQNLEFHTDDSFSRDDVFLLINKDVISLTDWRAQFKPITVVTWWPPEITNALRQVWQDAYDEFLTSIEKAKKQP